MDLSAISQSAFLYALGWAIAHSFWQMAALWLLWQLVSALHKNMAPALRFSLQFLLLLTGFLAFACTLAVEYSEFQSLTRYLLNLPAEDAQQAAAVRGQLTFQILLSSMSGWIEQYVPLFSAVYLVVLLMLFVRLLHAYAHTQKLRTEGLSYAGEELEDLLGKLCRHFRVPVKVRIYFSSLVDVPATIGFFKPVILLPVATANHLSFRETEAVIAHELAHILRRDYLLNILVSIVSTVLYFNPFANLLVAGLKKDRELYCDDFVLRFQVDPANYISALLNVERNRKGYPALFTLAASGQDGLLLQRVRRMMHLKPARRDPGQKLAALLLMASFLFSIAWINPLLPGRKPAQAKQPENATGSLVTSDMRDVGGIQLSDMTRAGLMTLAPGLKKTTNKRVFRTMPSKPSGQADFDGHSLNTPQPVPVDETVLSLPEENDPYFVSPDELLAFRTDDEKEGTPMAFQITEPFSVPLSAHELQENIRLAEELFRRIPGTVRGQMKAKKQEAEENDSHVRIAEQYRERQMTDFLLLQKKLEKQVELLQLASGNARELTAEQLKTLLEQTGRAAMVRSDRRMPENMDPLTLSQQRESPVQSHVRPFFPKTPAPDQPLDEEMKSKVFRNRAPNIRTPRPVSESSETRIWFKIPYEVNSKVHMSQPEIRMMPGNAFEATREIMPHKGQVFAFSSADNPFAYPLQQAPKVVVKQNKNKAVTSQKIRNIRARTYSIRIETEDQSIDIEWPDDSKENNF